MSTHRGLRAKIEGRGRILATGAAIAAVVALVVTGSAMAGNGDRATVKSSDIVDGEVRSNDIKNGGVYSPDINNQSVRQHDIGDGAVGWGELTPFNQERIDRGKVTGFETDGFYEDLPESDGTEVFTFTAECAEGKVALGGGFSIDFPQHRANVEFVGSTPADFTPIEGDPEGSVVSHGWEVQVTNDGPATSLRPWVVCAAAATP